MADGVVQRKRLFDLLAGPPAVRIVVAPSGFGKTTLVRSWADAAPRRALVWVAMGESITTRAEFWKLVGASAVRSDHLDAGTFAALSRAVDTLDDPIPAVARCLDDCGPILLVLDAYEHVRGVTEAIDADLLQLAAQVARLEIVVTTRATTRLGDDVEVIRGRVRVIDESDLRFTVHEVAELLELHAPQLMGAAERITVDTRGYPLGVRAVAHALRGRQRVPSVDSAAWKRLVTADLRSQIDDPALAEFILDTSVPPYVDRDLARRLTEADADVLLAELEWHGFGRWIPYARDQPVFQYVESVRDVFRERLAAEDPRRYERVAAISALWLDRHAEHGAALALAIEARQYDLAARICISLSAAGPDIYTTDMYERHLRQVPLEVLPRHPELAFALAMAHSTKAATRGASDEYFRIAARHALDDVGALTPQEVLHRHVGREVSLRYLGQSRQAAAAAEAGLAHLDSMSPADREELGDSCSMALAILAYSLFSIGDVDRATALVERAVASASGTWVRNYVSAFAGGFHGINGRLPEASAAIAAIDRDRWPDHPDRVIGERRLPHVLGVIGQATLRLDAFDHAAALAEYDEADWLLDVAQSWPFITWTLMHARLAAGEAGTEARRVADALAGRPPGIGPNLGTAALVNTLAVLWLADGQAAKGQPILRHDTPCRGQLAPARLLYQLVADDPAHVVRGVAALLDEPGHTVRSRAAVETLAAAAALRADNEPTAVALLAQAAGRFHQYGVRLHLLYLPATDLAALRELAGTAGRPACVAYLADPVVSPIQSVDQTPVLLTPREVEVLRVWATSRTRAEVATELFVSSNTVKSQLTSAYRKLGVSTKDAAIQRAIELGLFIGPAARRRGDERS